MKLQPKAPGESKLYIIPLDTELQAGDDYITSFTLSAVSGTVAYINQAHSAKVVSAVFTGGAGGTPGVFNLVVNTAGGQVITDQITIPVLATGNQPYTSTQKGALVSYAYEEALLAGYEFDVTTAEQTTALRRLDALMAEPPFDFIAYNYPNTLGTSALADLSNVPDEFFSVVGLQLALRLFPTLGKTRSAETSLAYSQGMANLRGQRARSMTRAIAVPGGVPVGAGRRGRSRYSPFTLPDRGYAQTAAAVTAGDSDTANIYDFVQTFEENAEP